MSSWKDIPPVHLDLDLVVPIPDAYYWVSTEDRNPIIAKISIFGDSLPNILEGKATSPREGLYINIEGIILPLDDSEKMKSLKWQKVEPYKP